MTNNIDLKNLWSQQDTGPKPDINEVVEKARRVKNKIRNQLLQKNILLAATVVFISIIGIWGDFALFITRLGIVLIVIAIVSYVTVSNGLLISLFKTNPEADNSTYLAELLTIRKKQEHLQGKMLTLYFILLSAGMFSYMIEFLLRMTLLWATVTAIITFGWIAVNWVFIRPKIVKKQQGALSDIISKLEAANSHYKEELNK
jgi:hypothetical protein